MAEQVPSEKDPLLSHEAAGEPVVPNEDLVNDPLATDGISEEDAPAETSDPIIIDDRELPQSRTRGPLKVSRRRLLVVGGVATVAAAGVGGGIAYFWRQWSQAQTAETLVNNMINEVIQGLPKDADLLVMAEKCGPQELNLDQVQEDAKTVGQLMEIVNYVFGTSHRFPLGLDNKRTPGDHNYQPHAIEQLGIDSISEQDLITMGLRLLAEVLARPGAYSGRGNYPNHNVGATDSIDGTGQIANSGFQEDARAIRGLPMASLEASFDDDRLLYDVMLRLMKGVVDPRQAMSNTISRDMQRRVEEFLAAMGDVAKGTGANILWAHDNFAQIDVDRRANNQPYPIVVRNDLTWKFDEYQRYFAISPIDNVPVDPLLSNWIVPDPFGPAVLNRAMLDTHALANGFGPKLALIAWTLTMVEYMTAIQTARAEHPQLHTVTNQLMYMNRLKYFYIALALYGQDKGKLRMAGDGHPGQAEGLIAGAEQLAVHSLMLLKRNVNGQRRSVGEFSPLYRPNDVAMIEALTAAAMHAAA